MGGGPVKEVEGEIYRFVEGITSREILEASLPGRISSANPPH